MNNLTILNKNGQLVVTSRQMAGDFEKENSKVTRDIENLIEGIAKNGDTYNNLFIRTEYQNEQNKQMYKEYLLTRDGFSLLVMGFTGAKALGWKLKYIQAFNEMEQSLKIAQPKLSKELQAIFAIDQRTVEIDNRLVKLENNMTIDYEQQEILNGKARYMVVKALGGKDAPAYKECNRKAFSELWRFYKRIMQVNSYKNTSTINYDKGREIIDNWKPNRDLELMILGANSQIRM